MTDINTGREIASCPVLFFIIWIKNNLCFILNIYEKLVIEITEDVLVYNNTAILESRCDFIQGFALARTNPADEMSAERGLEFI